MVVSVKSTEKKKKAGCHYQVACISDCQDVLARNTMIDGQKRSPTC